MSYSDKTTDNSFITSKESDKTTDNSFITSKEFAFYTDKKGNLMAGIRIDDVNKQVAFIKNGAVSRTVSYRDILGYDVSEENNTEQKISGRAGRTIAGGLLFGPLGALAGLMWLKILKERDIEVGFIEFLKVGLIVTPLCLAFTMATVMGMTFVV